MNICTITCHHAINHGAMLQAYALATFLKSSGHKVEVIDYLPDYLAPRPMFYRSPKFKKIWLGWLYAIVKFKGNYFLYKRKNIFEKFFYKYLPITKTHYSNLKELKENPPEADVYIAGSDQIWNTTFQNGMDPAFYLDFGIKDTKRISYAASYATDSIASEKIDFVKKKLSNFDAISVREVSAVTLSKALGYNAIQVVDPVFLLDRNEWNSLLKLDEYTLPVLNPCQDYVLVYDFMNDENVWSVVKRIAKLNGWKIFSIFENQNSDASYFYYGPTSFVYLIKNAQCVVSNSFHGIAFSMIYQKDFFVLNREDGLNNRMRDILISYGISERLINNNVTDDILLSHIDYKRVVKDLSRDIMGSKKWIYNTLTKYGATCNNN